jgi:hypothetical protein
MWLQCEVLGLLRARGRSLLRNEQIGLDLAGLSRVEEIRLLLVSRGFLALLGHVGWE